jgi:hypothetical protein
MKQHTITIVLPNVGEVDLSMLGSRGPLVYWLDERTKRVYSYHLDTAKFVARGSVTELALLPPNLRPE